MRGSDERKRHQDCPSKNKSLTNKRQRLHLPDAEPISDECFSLAVISQDTTAGSWAWGDNDTSLEDSFRSISSRESNDSSTS